jgi:hypothetical protein
MSLAPEDAKAAGSIQDIGCPALEKYDLVSPGSPMCRARLAVLF